VKGDPVSRKGCGHREDGHKKAALGRIENWGLGNRNVNRTAAFELEKQSPALFIQGFIR
jgi:hypothetical protein